MTGGENRGVDCVGTRKKVDVSDERGYILDILGERYPPEEKERWSLDVLEERGWRMDILEERGWSVDLL